MDILNSLGSGLKTVVSLIPDRVTPFSRYGSVAGADGGGYGIPFDSNFNNAFIHGDSVNGRPLHHIAGENGVVAACSASIAQAFISAPPILEEKHGNDWKRIDHPIIELLNTPNSFYGADHLWTRTLAGEIEGGEGYWRVVMNRARTQPVEIWFERDMWPQWDSMQFISRYMQRVDGKPYPLAAAANGHVNYRTDYGVHFRYQLDRFNPRRGWTPLSTVWRQIKGDESTAIWQGALLENGAGMALMVALKEGLTNSEQAPTKKLEEFIERMKRQLRGAGAGGIATSSLPVDVHKVSWSPEEMALVSLISYFETRICSVLDVPLMLVGLPDPGKTYANLAEADRQFWSGNIAPLQERHGSQLEAQLFPLYDDLDRTTHRISWDRSQVEAMQENVDAKHARVREDYKACIPDLFAAATLLGYKVDESARGVRYVAPKAQTDGMDNQPADEEKPAVKALQNFEEDDFEPDELGKPQSNKAAKLASPKLAALLGAKKEKS